MRRLDPKYIRIGGIVAAALLVIFLIVCYIAYSKRESILQHELVKITLKAKRDYNLEMKIASAHFVGLSTVEFKDITIVPEGRDSLLNIKHFNVGIKLFPLIFGKVKLADVLLENGHLNLTYDKLASITSGLDVDVAQVLKPGLQPQVNVVAGRRSTTRKGDGVLIEDPTELSALHRRGCRPSCVGVGDKSVGCGRLVRHA